MSDEAIDLAVFSELRSTAGAEFVADLVGTFCDDAAGMDDYVSKPIRPDKLAEALLQVRPAENSAR